MVEMSQNQVVINREVEIQKILLLCAPRPNDSTFFFSLSWRYYSYQFRGFQFVYTTTRANC
jgi:hypothetical protein